VEIQGLIEKEENMLYVGGIYVDALQTWTWADGWPSMKYSNWMNGVEPAGDSDIGMQKFLALIVSDNLETTGEWVPVDGEEELGAVYKCCDNGGNSGVAVRRA